MSRPWRLAPRGERDIAALLDWTAERFGAVARNRYERLIAAAFDGLADDPARAGVRAATDERPGVMRYHLRHARNLMDAPRVANPRHIVFFRIGGGKVTMLRVLHDAMDLPHHSMEDDSGDD